MQEIRLWALEQNDGSLMKAVPVDTLRNTQTEEVLEDLLVRSPDLLMEGLTLVGRQLPTKGGPLDLLGIDEDGRLVVFELKRGMLTRDAVTQAVDYASDLFEMDVDTLTKHLEDCSGQHGIDQIDDFSDWYDRNYPDNDGTLSGKPKIVLVGLGTDERALRMVNYLADCGLDIQLLTFHAFQRDDKLFLARQVESTTRSVKSVSGRTQRTTKKSNYEILFSNAQECGVKDFLDEIRAFFKQLLPVYEWPGKDSCSFYLTEKSERGNPTYRVYFSLYLRRNNSKALNLIVNKRALNAAPTETAKLRESFPDAQLNEKYEQLELPVTRENWDTLRANLETVLPAVEAGWKTKVEEAEKVEAESPSES